MKITVLDGFTLNPGDLSWEKLAALGELTVYDRTAPGETAARIGDAEIVFTNKTPLGAELLNAAPNLRFVGVLATGCNVVDIAAARRRGIVVCNVPGYSTDSVAQLTFALLLEICHHVGAHGEAVRGGRWSASPDFCFYDYPLLELAGKTFGVAGCGSIGKRTAQIARAFGMRVLGTGPTLRPEWREAGIEPVGWEAFLAGSDVISLHCPLTESNRHMINADSIGQMRDGVILLNTARGPLIDESALAAALRSGKVAAAGLDVLSTEPPPPDNPLLTAPNCILTPHIAWATLSARKRLLAVTVSNLRAYLDGAPCNVVS